MSALTWFVKSPSEKAKQAISLNDFYAIINDHIYSAILLIV